MLLNAITLLLLSQHFILFSVINSVINSDINLRNLPKLSPADFPFYHIQFVVSINAVFENIMLLLISVLCIRAVSNIIIVLSAASVCNLF